VTDDTYESVVSPMTCFNGGADSTGMGRAVVVALVEDPSNIMLEDNDGISRTYALNVRVLLSIVEML